MFGSGLVTGVALTSVELRLRRWINNSAGAVAYIEVTNASGDWNAVWDSPLVGGIIDPLWRLETYDVSALAAGNPSFRVRFRQWSYNASTHHAGWNVDELVVRDSSLPLFGSCGGCGGASSGSMRPPP